MLFGASMLPSQAALKAGLAVNIDLHDTYHQQTRRASCWPAAQSGALFRKRVTVTHSFAQHYAAYDPALVALELFNEPIDPGSINGDWLEYLNALYAYVRSAMPDHTLLLTMENWSDVGHRCVPIRLLTTRTRCG